MLTRVTPARTRLLLILLLLVVVNLGPAHAVVTGRGLDGNQAASVLVTNLVLLAAIGLFLLLRGRTRPELRMVATEDLVVSAEEPALERIHGNDYVVRGQVAEVGGDELLLQVADRRVRVLLDGHPVPAAAEGGAVQVRGTMIG